MDSYRENDYYEISFEPHECYDVIKFIKDYVDKATIDKSPLKFRLTIEMVELDDRVILRKMEEI